MQLPHPASLWICPLHCNSRGDWSSGRQRAREMLQLSTSVDDPGINFSRLTSQRSAGDAGAINDIRGVALGKIADIGVTRADLAQSSHRAGVAIDIVEPEAIPAIALARSLGAHPQVTREPIGQNRLRADEVIGSRVGASRHGREVAAVGLNQVGINLPTGTTR